jgi:signal transduction histidine kinase
MSVDADAELVELRTVLRDLVALSAIPAAWVGREPAIVAAGLADALIGLLQLDFAYVRLCVPDVAGVVEVTRGDTWKTFPQWLASHLAENGRLSAKQVIPDVGGGAGQFRGVVIPIGVDAEGGMVAAACDRADFPAAADLLLLTLAANHAAAVFQSVRLNEYHAQMWFLESLDRIDRAIQGTSDLDRMMGNVLDVVLATFGSDRAFLVYPCDPEPFQPGDPEIQHRVRVERTRPEYAGARADGSGIPGDPEIAEVSRLALASADPVRYDPKSGHAVPAQLLARFGVQAMMVLAIYPNGDKPYLFGLHQCSYRRVWTPHEERLFHEIGRRLADALDTQLMVRDLRESERKLERSRAELAASRARIVTAADETRRRIERDLHDGVQQRLVSLLLRQRTMEAMTPPGLLELRAQMADFADGLAGALTELQEIARGIHPAILTDGGLARALKSLARRSAVPVQLDVRFTTRLPEPVEVAAYYVVSEALTNTAKHGHASVVHVVLDADHGVLELSIRDDGSGGADPTRGSGLMGLTDRVEALGGTIDVTSAAGQGTTLHVALPAEARLLTWRSGMKAVSLPAILGLPEDLADLVDLGQEGLLGRVRPARPGRAPRSARNREGSLAGSRSHLRRRVDQVDRHQRPAHPGHRGVRVVAELTGRLCATAADAKAP